MRGPTIVEAGEVYLTGRVARGELMLSSAKKIRLAIRQLAEAAGDKRVGKLSKGDAEAWLAWTAERGQKASTRRLRWSYLNVFGEWLVDEEMIARNPFRTVKPPKPPRRTPRPLSRDEVAAVLEVVGDDLRDRLIAILMVQQGLRAMCVANLQMEDMDLDGRWMRIVGKGGHERTLWITDETWEALAAYLAAYPCETGPVVRAWRPTGTTTGTGELVASGRPLTPASVSKFMSGWMYEAGVKQGPWDGKSGHALRHTAATDMLDEGADIMDVSAMLGHASVGTTMIYTKVRPERMPGAMGGRRYGGPGLVAVGG